MNHTQRLAEIDARIKQRLADLDACTPERKLPSGGLMGYAIATAPLFVFLFATLANLGV